MLDWKGVTTGTSFYSRQQSEVCSSPFPLFVLLLGKGTSLGVRRGRAMAMQAKAQAAGRGAAPGLGVVPPVRR
ncbi:hypothetical protein BC332_10520 [Capsicum chinense]|nr:hypothetical protein BC332_10520 [Capsicum chinense]